LIKFPKYTGAKSKEIQSSRTWIHEKASYITTNKRRNWGHLWNI